VGLVAKDSLAHEIRHKLGETLKADIVEANIKALERAYSETKEG
jgi:Pyruvate/2-oxoacid:ferredoxin oxidoreductase gamma subunit